MEPGPAALGRDPVTAALPQCVVAMRDPEFVRAHRRELSYLTGRFLTEHLIRVRACNALSISTAIGIPRETIARFHAASRDFLRHVDRRAPAHRAATQVDLA